MWSSIEKQNNFENPENTELLDSLSSDMENEEDKKVAGEILQWFQTNPSLNDDENFKNAFHSKIDEILQKNLKNLPAEKIESLKTLQKQDFALWNTKDFVHLYKEIDQIIHDRNAESAKAGIDKTYQERQKQTQDLQKDSQNFLDALKKSLGEEQKLAQEKAEKLAEKKQIAQERGWEDQEKAWEILDWLSESFQG